MDRVFEALRRYPAPYWNSSQIVETGDWTEIPLLGTVKHVVHDSQLMVENITREDHLLHPGVVYRSVVNDGNEIGIHTFGEGEGSYKEANEFFSDPLWQSLDERIQNYLGYVDIYYGKGQGEGR